MALVTFGVADAFSSSVRACPQWFPFGASPIFVNKSCLLLLNRRRRHQLGGFNQSVGSAADYGDFNATTGNDPFGFSYTNVTQPLTGNDVVTLAAIGRNPTSHGVTHAQAAATYALV